MYEIKSIRFSAAIIVIMAICIVAYHAKAAAMTIISESHQNALREALKDPKLTFGDFDVLALLGSKNSDTKESISNTIGIFDTNSKKTKERVKKAAIIDKYFHDRNMPLEGYGKKLIDEAEKYNLDWRLLPAIAIRESSGGKLGCANNQFGWASCKVDFDTIDNAIETVAWNLGGGNPRTKQYYDGDTIDKLYYYNGTVINGYAQQVIRIMTKIADENGLML